MKQDPLKELVISPDDKFWETETLKPEDGVTKMRRGQRRLRTTIAKTIEARMIGDTGYFWNDAKLMKFINASTGERVSHPFGGQICTCITDAKNIEVFTAYWLRFRNETLPELRYGIHVWKLTVRWFDRWAKKPMLVIEWREKTLCQLYFGKEDEE